MTQSPSVQRAIILSAGKGSRLLPLTAQRPKCLIDFAGRSLLQWQLHALSEAGIEEIFVVTGFRPEMVDEEIAQTDCAAAVRTVYNPFYHVADNLGSVWMAREWMERDFLLLNGDTLVSTPIVRALLEARHAPVTVTVDEKEEYDADDMKVLREGDRLVRISKQLAPGGYNAESIGFLRFLAEGRSAFAEAVDQVMRTPEGTSHFYLRVIDRLADTGIVSTVSIRGEEWAEVDFPEDLDKARQLTAKWADASGGPARAEPIA